MTKPKATKAPKVKAEKTEVVIPVVLAEKTMAEQLAEMKAQMALLMKANSDLTSKLVTKKSKAGMTEPEKNEIRINKGLIDDPFNEWKVEKRVAMEGEKITNRRATMYFTEQSALNDCKKAKKAKDPALETLAIVAGVKAMKRLYPDRVLTDETIDTMINALTKARSANRKDGTILQYGSILTKGMTVYRAVNKEEPLHHVDVLTVDSNGNGKFHGYGRVVDGSKTSETVISFSKPAKDSDIIIATANATVKTVADDTTNE